MVGVKSMVFGAATDVVTPFGKAKDIESGDESDKDDKVTIMKMWCGPIAVGPLTVGLHGPLQLFFAIISLGAIGLLIYVIAKKLHTVCLIVAITAVVCALYLTYLGKAIYIMKMFRHEISRFRRENNEYKKQNDEHKKLNDTLSSKVDDLSRVEKQLSVLATECEGSVAAARALLDRLERSVKLNTVNSVFLFYDRSDRDKNGRIDPHEVDVFVDNLGFLWGHLPGFDKDSLKASLKEQGGISLEQVHELVETTMRICDEEALKQAEKKLGSTSSAASVRRHDNAQTPGEATHGNERP
eukprot:TRINITY_DN8295_c0_g1_i2.p1 TRINITY_DN8295_c0_g1~~TRINITY_DN8295_c0_g1_i2.p1  ORF type:complete len:298 (+),score=69.01 TRINITY_DN8295_c0_g1_i2:90-983(+)